jgi:hypothetical protein
MEDGTPPAKTAVIVHWLEFRSVTENMFATRH